MLFRQAYKFNGFKPNIAVFVSAARTDLKGLKKS